MVGPGEVDEDLEPETAEECGKYGKVSKVMIYEVRNKLYTCRGTSSFVKIRPIVSEIYKKARHTNKLTH